MRVSVNQRGYTLSGLTTVELNTVMFLLGQIKKQCFCDCDYDKETGRYCDGGGFVASFGPEEREALYSFVDGFWHEYDKLEARFQQTKKKQEAT
ncbi:MAG: hypothetical protein LBB85_11775 [Dysgonamonadaceae bacterium]|nr:hypothetical protein [Dysgonamonadaceae bacterium]